MSDKDSRDSKVEVVNECKRIEINDADANRSNEVEQKINNDKDESSNEEDEVEIQEEQSSASLQPSNQDLLPDKSELINEDTNTSPEILNEVPVVTKVDISPESDYDNLSEPEENQTLIPKTTVRPHSLHGDLSNIKREFNNALNDRNSVTYVPNQSGQGDVPIKLIKSPNPEIEVLLNTPVEEERSWMKIINNASRLLPQKKRMQYLPDQRRNEALPYKAWLLGLTKKHRFQIIIGLGILVWIAFFIGLAIVVNSNNDEGESPITGGSGKVDVGNTDVHKLPTVIKNMTSINATTVPSIHEDKLNTTPSAAGNDKETTNIFQMPVTETPSTTSLEETTASTTLLEPTTNEPTTLSAISLTTTERTTTSSSTQTPSIEPTTTSSTTIAATTEKTTSSLTRTPSIEPTTALSTTIAATTEKTTFSLTQTPSIEPTTTSSTTIEATTEKTTSSLTQTPSVEPKTLNTTTASMFSTLYAFQSDTVMEVLNEINYTAIQDEFSSLENLIKDKEPNYRFGIGRADMTGPAADVNMMGYANPSQTSGGIHLRQFSRAFIITDGDKEQGKRVVFVNIDACMASTLLKLKVMEKLKELYGDLYQEENVCISGTHTHSAPAGFLQDVLFQITSWGYVEETLIAMVNGIVKSIVSAHENIAPGFILLNKGELLDSNINRSPSAYLFNSPQERARYKYDVDKDMTLLKFVDEHGKGRGMINWFPVHCTSMNNTNTLISGDNKGYAELLIEKEMDPDSLPGESSFVAAFAQSNEGDVSPNTNGAHCVGTNISCANDHSTCNGKVKDCIATGPGEDMFESTKIIGTNQYEKALDLFHSASILLDGPIQFVHQYVNMTNYELKLPNNQTVKTCKPAMGFSFAAGTTDGPGAFDFKQGDTTGGNTFWKIIRGFLRDPSDDQENCHAPKPVLIDTGEMSSPYSWQPEVVDNQIFRIGQFFMIAVPGEFTTMAGRRVRETVLKTLADHFPDEKVEAVISGLSNTYSDYIATYEEYQAQRYEGASTIYGPFTLHAYLDHYKKLTDLLATERVPAKKAAPVDLYSQLMSFTPRVFYDLPMTGYDFGSVIDEARSVYKMGEEVIVTFMAGNPRNTLKMKPETHFSLVEMQQDDGTWKVVYNDASWDTKYIWIRTSTIFAQSEVTIKWKINPLTTKTGKYRIRHNGHYKYHWTGNIFEYTGTSKVFDVAQ